MSISVWLQEIEFWPPPRPQPSKKKKSELFRIIWDNKLDLLTNKARAAFKKIAKHVTLIMRT